MKRIANKPANGDIDLGLAHQLAIVNDASQQTGEHQPHRYLRIDPGPAILGAIAAGDFFPEPRQVEHAVNADQNVFIRNELPE